MNSAAGMHTTALHCFPTDAIAALPEYMEPTCNPGARRRVPNRPSQANMRQAVNVNAHTHERITELLPCRSEHYTETSQLGA
jgi:hypothetical protein